MIGCGIRCLSPKYVKTSPAGEILLTDDEVDLYRLPIPMSSIFDGGPMITAGVVIARDPERTHRSPHDLVVILHERGDARVRLRPRPSFDRARSWQRKRSHR